MTGSSLIASIRAVGFGLLGGAVTTSLMLRMAAPPVLPIAILDRGALLKKLDAGVSQVDRAALIQQFESIARHLADAGYLVLDRGWVIAAPEEFYVNPE